MDKVNWFVLGEPLEDIVDIDKKKYRVNTVAMNYFASMVNPLLDLRNEMFGIKGVAETMIFDKGDIVHCQRYRKIESAMKRHKKLVNKLKQGNTSFFNGDGCPLRGVKDASE